jgi:hypothetical protein
MFCNAIRWVSSTSWACSKCPPAEPAARRTPLRSAAHGDRVVERELVDVAKARAGRIIEAPQIYAHVPGLLRGYGKLEQTTAKPHRVDKGLRALAELKAATPKHCASQHRHGLADLAPLGLRDEEPLAPSSYRARARAP